MKRITTLQFTGLPRHFSSILFFPGGFLRPGAPRPPAGEARAPSAISRPAGGGGWGDGEEQLRGETQNVTFKPAEKTGTRWSERVWTSRWSRARLRGLISRAAPSFRENRGSATLKCQLRSREWVKGVPLLTSRATTQFVLHCPPHPPPTHNE